MTAPELLETIKARGAAITARGTGAGVWLHVAPRGVLTRAERVIIRTHETELLELLAEPPATGAHRWQPSPPAQPTDLHLLVRAQLRALDNEIGAAAACLSVVRATVELDAKHAGKQWRARPADLKHAEAVAIALLDNGIDPATVAD